MKYVILLLAISKIFLSCRKPNNKVSINGQIVNLITSAPLANYQITIQSTVRVKGGMGEHSQSITKRPVISDLNGNFTSTFEVSSYNNEKEYTIQDSLNNIIFKSTQTGNIGSILINP